MSSPAPTAEHAVDLKNRWLAAGLALVVPGLGHLYQGRIFKAVVYGVCILGLFFSGQALGDWKVVYLSDSEAGGRFAAGGGLVKRLLQGYGAQFPVGVFAWPAIVQNDRYQSQRNDARVDLAGPLTSEFVGDLRYQAPGGKVQPLVGVTGTVSLEPAGESARGKLLGTTADGKPIEIQIASVFDLGRKVSANERRTLKAKIAALPDGVRPPAGADVWLDGWVPRPLRDRYQVPLGDQGEDELTAKLGGRLEIAYVFTWIAGLLNVLAIWDALDGPAYGLGNEPELNRKRRKDDEEPDASRPDRIRRPEPAGRPA